MNSLSVKTETPLLFFISLILCMLLGALIGGGIAAAIALSQGLDVTSVMQTLNENSPLGIRNYFRTANLVSHIMTFSVPAFIIAILFFKKDWIKELGLQRPPALVSSLMAIGVILLSFPIAQLTYWLNKSLPLPESWMQTAENTERLLQAIMVMDTVPELLLNILVVGVAAAVGEELVFRGLIQRQLSRLTEAPVLSIWITAFVFSCIHLQFDGFFPRMLLGAVLGYLFHWTRNLWIPIIAHFVFNSMQVVAQYFLGDQISEMEVSQPDLPQILFTIAALAGLLYLGRQLQQKSIQQEQV